MNVKVNSTVWGSIFAVPTCIVDEHIKLAGGQQLKVLLFVMRHHNENVSSSDIAKGVGMSEGDVKDALGYWIETGIIFEDGKAVKETSPVVADIVNVDTKKDFQELPDVAPTYEQVAMRLLEDNNLKGLFSEVQLKLGRTIGYGDQAKLLMMHDYYGLPVEVILTIVEYCVSIDKTSMAYMGKVAKDWGEKDINTLEAADAKLKELRADEQLWKKFAAMFSVDAPKYTDIRFTFLKKWCCVNKQSFELIYYAYEVMVERTNTVNFKYMDKMLESWKEDGLKKPQDVMQNGTKKHGAAVGEHGGSNTRFGSTEKRVSYDSDKVKQKARGPIEYKRRNADGK